MVKGVRAPNMAHAKEWLERCEKMLDEPPQATSHLGVYARAHAEEFETRVFALERHNWQRQDSDPVRPQLALRNSHTTALPSSRAF